MFWPTVLLAEEEVAGVPAVEAVSMRRTGSQHSSCSPPPLFEEEVESDCLKCNDCRRLRSVASCSAWRPSCSASSSSGPTRYLVVPIPRHGFEVDGLDLLHRDGVHDFEFGLAWIALGIVITARNFVVTMKIRFSVTTTSRSCHVFWNSCESNCTLLNFLVQLGKKCFPKIDYGTGGSIQLYADSLAIKNAENGGAVLGRGGVLFGI